MNDEIKNQFEIKESVIVEGITEDYVWYHHKKLFSQMQTWQYEFERMVNVMEARHKEHLKIIEDLLRQNKFLKSKVKENES
jgi:predicted patatin/cPLA2 family phospholipase